MDLDLGRVWGFGRCDKGGRRGSTRNEKSNKKLLVWGTRPMTIRGIHTLSLLSGIFFFLSSSRKSIDRCREALAFTGTAVRVGLLLSRKRLEQITRTFWVLPVLGAGINYSAEAVSITRLHVGDHQAKGICHVGCFAKRVWIHWMYHKVPIILARLFSMVRR